MAARTADVAIVGSGFAGTILARALCRIGLEVVLVEKGRHPRFALGESSTPLANFCLERLARRYDLPDLACLATYGCWMAAYPELRRGLKRGFTFYHHQPGVEFAPGGGNENRLLVAASPDDDRADTHWLRADVDAFLARRAVEEGVELRQQCEVVAVTPRAGGYELLLAPRSETITARFVIDATGPLGAVGEALGAGRRQPAARFSSCLVYGHFSGVGRFDPEGAFESGPYPDEKAAVHHLLEEGWMYVLPFDHDCVSAGLVLVAGAPGLAPSSLEVEELWRGVLGRYPSLARQFARTRPLRPLIATAAMQYRRCRASGFDSGHGWALLPHAFAFFDPIFSTGIAWSLLGVERLAAAFESLVDEPKGGRIALELASYDEMLRREAEQIERLVMGAYLARRDPVVFSALAFLYFAAVSYEELGRRLLGDTVWQGGGGRRGFLGAGEPGWESLFEEAAGRLAGLARTPEEPRRALASGFADWVRCSIAPRNLIGLADPKRRNLYPVDLERLCDRASLLGLSPTEMASRLPRLRGPRASEGAFPPTPTHVK